MIRIGPTLCLAALFAVPLSLAACGQEPDAGSRGEPAPAAAAEQIAGGAATSETVTDPAGASGLCAANEPVVFNCRLNNGKLLSVCGAADAGAKRFAQYRFGPAGKPVELVWPEKAAAGQLSWASIPYSGGGEAQLSFASGASTYVVYSRVIRTNFTAGEPNDPALEDGVFVTRNGKTIAAFSCDDPDVTPIDYELAAQLARNDPEAFVIPGQ